MKQNKWSWVNYAPPGPILTWQSGGFWVAAYESGGTVGQGGTEQAAIADLIFCYLEKSKEDS